MSEQSTTTETPTPDDAQREVAASDASLAAREAEPSIADGAEPQRVDDPRPQRLGAAPAPAPLPTSIGLDTNTRLTLLFLALVTLVAGSAWGTAKLACNYHPASSQKFEPAPLDKRVLTPKDAALEFHHRLFLQEYDAASALALEAGIDVVAERKNQCDAACKAERERRVQEANTRAILHRVRGLSAWTTAETFFDGRVVSEDYELRRIDRRWLVVGRSEPPPP